MNLYRKLPCLPFVLGILLTNPGSASAQAPEFMVDFRDPDHRAATTEDGLEFLEVYGPWALYEVTSTTPRIYFPHTLQPDPGDGRHDTRICYSNRYFSHDYDRLVEEHGPCGRDCVIHVGMVSYKLMGSVGGVPQEIHSTANAAKPFDTCRGESDAGYWINTTEVIDNIYFEIEPAPPLGSVIPLRMVAMGNGLNVDNHERPLAICCHDETLCDVGQPPIIPPEPPGGGGGSDGGDEPPGGGGFDGGEEPPGTSNDGGNDLPVEPPGFSNPPPPAACATAPHRAPPGDLFWLLFLVLGLACSRRTRARIEVAR